MASTSDTKTPKLTVLVIKRGSLYKPNSSIFLKTPIKRPISSDRTRVQINELDAKRKCSESDVSPAVLIKKHAIGPPSIKETDPLASEPRDSLASEPTDPLLNKATDQLSIETTDKLSNISTDHVCSKRKKHKAIMPRTPKLPKNKCEQHQDLYEHKAVGLPLEGDTFNSVEEFYDYNISHASQWLFYYVRYDTRNPKHGSKYNSKKPSFSSFECRFNHKECKSQSKGIRKRKEKKSFQCPASLTLKCNPGDDVFVVTEACHHHSHELSIEMYNQLPQGIKALPQDVKEEIRDLAQFNVNPLLLRRYIESKLLGGQKEYTTRKQVYNHLKKMKSMDTAKNMTAERVKQILDKITYIKANFDVPVKRRSTSKKPVLSSGLHLTNEPVDDPPEGKDAQEGSSNVSYHQECVQSVEELHKSSCETQINPWVEPVAEEVEVEVEVEYQNNAAEIPKEVTTEHGITIIPSVPRSYQQVFIDSSNQAMHEKEKVVYQLIAGSLEDRSPTFTLADNETQEIDPNISDNHQTENQVTESSNKSIKQYTIRTVKSVEDSGNASIALHKIKSKQELNEGFVNNELVKLEGAITEAQSCDVSGIENSVVEVVDVVAETSSKRKRKILERIDPKIVTPEKMAAAAEARCRNRHGELQEYHAEGFIKIGDTFTSMAEFTRYCASYAWKWLFYYQVHDSRNVRSSAFFNKNKTTWYNFSCRYNKGWYKSTSTGVRKVRQKTIQCPAAVSMRSKAGEDLFTVVYVCHHHSHELTPEIFSQEAHGHRLPPEMKDEIRELAWYHLDSRLIKQYLQEKTGFDLKLTVKNVIYKMRKDNVQINVSPEREKQILETIAEINNRFTIPKRAAPLGRKKRPSITETEPETMESDDENRKSRVEVRLNNLPYDHELIQSVKELQESTGCDLQLNEWGKVDVVGGTTCNLQEGLQDDTGYDVQDDNNVVCDNEIEIEEAYSMDENVRYIIPHNQEGYVFGEQGLTEECGEVQDNQEGYVFGEQGLTEECGEVQDNQEGYVFGEQGLTEECGEVQDNQEGYVFGEQGLTEECGEVQDNQEEYVFGKQGLKEECGEVQDNQEGYVFGEQGLTEDCGEVKDNVNLHNLSNEVENTDNCLNDEALLDDIDEDEVDTESSKRYQEATFEYSDNELKYQPMHRYTNDEEDSCKNNSEHVNPPRPINNTYESRDIGVQVETYSIDLAKDYKQIERLEAITLEHDIRKNKHKYATTRGKPQLVLEEAIINRYNIDFYISYSGVIPCLENLAAGMQVSALELLRKLYNGDAVFKMKTGRSGKSGRKSVQLTYVPLTISFPYEKFKYTGCLEEYKKMCIKYSDVSSKLEDAAEKLSSELKAMTTKYENAVSEHDRLLTVLENHEEVLNIQHITAQLLKKNQDDLVAEQDAHNITKTKSRNELQAAHAQIEKLLKKVKEQEELWTLSRLKDIEILKSNQVPPAITTKENKYLRERIRELEETYPVNVKLTQMIQGLENSLKESEANSKRNHEKVKKLEELYCTDSKVLFEKIKRLEEDLSASKADIGYNKGNENPASYIIRYTESENKRLYREIKRLETDNKNYILKVKMLNDSIISLNTKLDELKPRNYRINS